MLVFNTISKWNSVLDRLIPFQNLQTIRITENLNDKKKIIEILPNIQ